ncbi:hypothetical protein LJR129_004954 [Acidovorax sp. LjRoot129]|uniref:hypothetical protein n=1 Tax=unclassified Acidovorax TaxID=2684926 RepID=UPI003ECCB04E
MTYPTIDSSSTSDNAVELARHYLSSQRVIAIVFFGMGAGIVLETARISAGGHLPNPLDSVLLATMYALGLAFFAGSILIGMGRFRPLGDDGLLLLEVFPFNKAGKSHLEKALAGRAYLRVVDLQQALKTHFDYEAQLQVARGHEPHASALASHQGAERSFSNEVQRCMPMLEISSSQRS